MRLPGALQGFDAIRSGGGDGTWSSPMEWSSLHFSNWSRRLQALRRWRRWGSGNHGSALRTAAERASRSGIPGTRHAMGKAAAMEAAVTEW